MTLKPPPYRLKLLSHQCLTQANAKAVNVVSIIIAMFKFKKKIEFVETCCSPGKHIDFVLVSPQQSGELLPCISLSRCWRLSNAHNYISRGSVVDGVFAVCIAHTVAPEFLTVLPSCYEKALSVGSILKGMERGQRNRKP